MLSPWARIKYWRRICECAHNARYHVTVKHERGTGLLDLLLGGFYVATWSRCHFPTCNCLWFKGIEK